MAPLDWLYWEAGQNPWQRWKTSRRRPLDSETMHGVAGACAGALAAVFVCPLDVVKTRMQVQRHVTGVNVKYTTTVGSLRTIVREEGSRALYKGLTPTIVALLPNWAVYFAIYERLKRFLSRRLEDGLGPLRSLHQVHMASAAGAGAASILATNPFWVVRTRLQTQGAGPVVISGVPRVPYRGTLDCLRRMVAEEGVASLYSGLAPSLVGVAHVVVQFPLYEALKSWLAERQGVPVESLGLSGIICASAASKMVAATLTYPHEVVRSRMHVQGTGPFQGGLSIARAVLAEDGIRGFYRGCATNLLRTTPAAVVIFLSYELILRQLRAANESILARVAAADRAAGAQPGEMPRHLEERVPEPDPQDAEGGRS